MPRIGLLAWSDCDEPTFVRGLAQLGYLPGETVTIECRSADGRYDTLRMAAAELAALDVDVIVSLSQPAGMAARDATDTIPIVSIISGDPVAVDLAQSLARPGGNLTGLSYYANELTAKRLEHRGEVGSGASSNKSWSLVGSARSRGRRAASRAAGSSAASESPIPEGVRTSIPLQTRA